MFPLDTKTLQSAIAQTGIVNISSATIRQIGALAATIENIAGERAVHLELGNPGLPASEVGIKAQCKALLDGCANTYPNIAGVPEIKNAGSRFVKSFLNIDIDPKHIVPTVGSMQGCYTIMTLLKQCDSKKDTILFINPGFPAQRHQAKVLGIKEASFDVYNYRGAKLRDALEQYLSKGNIMAILYSNPNNPAWTNLTDEELRIIAEMSDKYDAIVLEDMAYMGMDFRTDFSKPGVEPYIPTVAKYTDNYILFMSASKIFSYAGERIALVCLSDKVYNRRYQEMSDFFEMPDFGDCYVYGVLYTASSGTSHSVQYAMAAMMEAACDGELDFVGECSEYGRRAAVVKKIFTDNGFNIVYDIDGDQPISDGFFFTVGYNNMPSDDLQLELLRYGVAAISLPSTGSKQNGIRACVSMISDPETFQNFEKRIKQFHNDH